MFVFFSFQGLLPDQFIMKYKTGSGAAADRDNATTRDPRSTYLPSHKQQRALAGLAVYGTYDVLSNLAVEILFSDRHVVFFHSSYCKCRSIDTPHANSYV